MAGTSGTSILQKPGITPGFRIFAHAPPRVSTTSRAHRAMGRRSPSWNLSRCFRLIQAGHQGELM
jgi:hypothetical protein